MKKILGITGLLVLVVTYTAAQGENFLTPYNLENLIRRTGLFGVLSIGAAFVIITGGIDLSIGSVVGLVGTLLPLWVFNNGWPPWLALAAVLLLALAFGLLHGLLVTRAGLQPFVVTLCGLLFYRGAARWVANDQAVGFGTEHKALRSLATGKPLGLATLTAVLGGLGLIWFGREFLRRADEGRARRLSAAGGAIVAATLLGVGIVGALGHVPVFSEIRTPAPFLFLVVLALLGGFFLNETVWGRHLLAVGKNPEAARYSGIRSERLVLFAYVVCAACAGLGGVLFALDQNTVQPSSGGNFYELYAIAAAVLGGCSLRGGEGSILGVVVGTALVRALYNSINLLGIPTQLEFAIIGVVILAGVLTDELVKRAVARRRAARMRGA